MNQHYPTTGVIALLAIAAACGGGHPSFIECRDDTSCDLQSGGRCLVNPDTGHKFCAYPEPNCPGGYRWSDQDVESSIAGMCIGGAVIDAGVVDADDIAPTVVAISPIDGATSVVTTTAVTATFSEPVDHSTITSTTFQVVGPGGAAQGTFLFNGDDVTFSSATRLDPDVQYTVTITTGVKDLAGNALASAFTSTFTTKSGGWTDPALLSTNSNEGVSEYDAAIRNGHGVAVWISNTCNGSTCGAPYTLRAMTYDAGVWAAPVLVASGATINDGMNSPRVAIDASGNATVAWLQIGSNAKAQVWASHLTAAGSWTNAAEIEPEQGGHAQEVSISSDSSGNVVAVWSQYDASSVLNVWANRYSASSGTWGTAAMIETGAQAAYAPSVAALEDGTAVALFSQNSIEYWSRYNNGSWSAPSNLSTHYALKSPMTRADSNGGVIAVWISSLDVYAARFNGAWTSPAPIDALDEGILVPARLHWLATSSTGKAIALWSQGQTAYDLYQATFDGTQWGSAFVIETFAGNSSDPAIAFGQGDRAMAVWNQGASVVGWSGEDRAGSGWQPPAALPTNGTAGVLLFDDTSNVFLNVEAHTVVGYKSMFWSKYE